MTATACAANSTVAVVPRLTLLNILQRSLVARVTGLSVTAPLLLLLPLVLLLLPLVGEAGVVLLLVGLMVVMVGKPSLMLLLLHLLESGSLLVLLP